MNIMDYGTIFNALAFSMYDAEKALLPTGLESFNPYHATTFSFDTAPRPSLPSTSFGNETWLKVDGSQTDHAVVTRTNGQKPGDQWGGSRKRYTKLMKIEVEFEFHQECTVGIGITYGEYSVHRFSNPALSQRLRHGRDVFEGLARRPGQAKWCIYAPSSKIWRESVVDFATGDVDGMWIAVYAPIGEGFGADMSVLMADGGAIRDL
ncbi:hypothetical protein ARMGADRAFT_1163817 [Armillaria gallica]|uniref:Uncharacterized protein n=1 Tax=Armillaria gallica TaxID=47427 RepID=A0A2H3DIX5_ARMGA|nr:hypothetical protein ARMGADRAFT_1163817 [Armillaria gallica]